MKPASASKSLREEIERLGWHNPDERLWERLGDFQQGLVILAPPFDTIPSPTGNAIYSLVEELASRLSIPTLVLARWPGNGGPQECAISDRILYDTAPLQPGWFESHLPYRLKRFFTGSGAPYFYAYARRAAHLCQLLKAKTILVEDMPFFSLPIHKHNPQARVYLHQHNNAIKSVPSHYWRKVVSSLDGIIFVAEATRSFTESLHGTLDIPSCVVYNGVDLSHYDPDRWRSAAVRLRQELKIAPDEKILLFVGRFAPVKGVAEAVEAFNLACFDRAHFVIVGSVENNLFSNAEYVQRVRIAAGELGDRIHLVGSKSQSELPAYYAASDVVIIPSLGSEGLPKVITEALAMGKPCLVSERGGALELIQEHVNGWIIANPLDIPDLAARISSALERAGKFQIESTKVDIKRMVMEIQRAIGLEGS